MKSIKLFSIILKKYTPSVKMKKQKQKKGRKTTDKPHRCHKARREQVEGYDVHQAPNEISNFSEVEICRSTARGSGGIEPLGR